MLPSSPRYAQQSSQRGLHYCYSTGLHTEITPLVLLVLRLPTQTVTTSLALLGLQLHILRFVSLHDHVIQFLKINIFILYIYKHTHIYIQHTYPIGSVFLETLANTDTYTHFTLLANK